MTNALVVGGNSGIGLAVVFELIEKGYDKIYIVGKSQPEATNEKIVFLKANLINEDYSFLNSINDIDTLVITAGFGRLALFENLRNAEISNLIEVNFAAASKILKHFYFKIKSNSNFYTAVVSSIAGHLASPFFSVYGASKSGLSSLIENINSELMAEGFENRILDISPGSIKGTGFNGGKTDLPSLKKLASEILENMFLKNTLFIPEYDKVYKNVLNRYRQDPKNFGLESYNYKKQWGRISNTPQLSVGYLSGTFDLFHIGHLNLLKRAKENCDFLIVGVHKSGEWKGKKTFIPFDERKEIIKSVRYVDKAVEAFKEDADAFEKYRYTKLFVGSDYKGSDRFKRYEEFFKNKNVDIIYFPYTRTTSSTELRKAITNHYDG